MTATAPTGSDAAAPVFDGVLFFPVTPFGTAGRVDLDLLTEHVENRLPFAPGGVFPACGTGEFHALSAREAIDANVAPLLAVEAMAVALRTP